MYRTIHEDLKLIEFGEIARRSRIAALTDIAGYPPADLRTLAVTVLV
jgi:hypothetical protein